MLPIKFRQNISQSQYQNFQLKKKNVENEDSSKDQILHQNLEFYLYFPWSLIELERLEISRLQFVSWEHTLLRNKPTDIWLHPEWLNWYTEVLDHGHKGNRRFTKRLSHFIVCFYDSPRLLNLQYKFLQRFGLFCHITASWMVMSQVRCGTSLNWETDQSLTNKV